MNFDGTALNERLYLSGKIEEFDKALAEKNKDHLIAILQQIKVSEPSIHFFPNEMKLNTLKEEE